MRCVKKKVGYKAAELIEHGMRVGIGTGSTVFFFIERLIQRFQEGLVISTFSSSLASEKLLRAGGIPLLTEMTELDISVDGADEIDPQKRMIKGGGGALFREKIMANASLKRIVIVDESKCVPRLGKHPLPVEITPYAHTSIIHKINLAGYQGHLRPSLTDNKNYIYDIHFDTLRTHPELDDEKLLHIPGVIETGFFFNLATKVLVGYENGEVKCLS